MGYPFLNFASGAPDPLSSWVDLPGQPVTITSDFVGLNYWQSSTVTWPPLHLADFTSAYTRKWLDFTGASICTWGGCELSAGVYTFTGWAAALSQNSGKKLIMTVGGHTPTFYTTDGSTYGPLKDPTVWANYVNALCDWIVANDTARQIAIMGPHNEPDAFAAFFYQGGDLDLAQRAATFYRIVKGKCPWILVMTPEVGVLDTAYWATMLKNGIGQSSDVVAVHGYIDTTVTPRREFSSLLSPMAQFLAMKAADPTIAGKPIICTEGGYGNDIPGAGGSQFFTDTHQAAFVPQWDFGFWWFGSQLNCWYIHNAKHNANGTQAGWGTLVDQTSGNITQAGTAWQQSKLWGIGATLTAFQQRGANQFRHKLTRPGGYQAEIYYNNGNDGPYQFEVPATQYRDIAGNTTLIPAGSKAVWVPINTPLLIETGAPS